MIQKLQILDLFSGIGGFSLGLERTDGFRTVAFCESDPFCREVLQKGPAGANAQKLIAEIYRLMKPILKFLCLLFSVKISTHGF